MGDIYARSVKSCMYSSLRCVEQLLWGFLGQDNISFCGHAVDMDFCGCRTIRIYYLQILCLISDLVNTGLNPNPYNLNTCKHFVKENVNLNEKVFFSYFLFVCVCVKSLHYETRSICTQSLSTDSHC